jgi:glutamyl-tRNA synthetase
LIKSDGFPTYHLANVVDDHEMRISHVIRERSGLQVRRNTFCYRALGLELPQFAHLPLLLNPDRSKLSKRQGDVAVEDYRDHGYFPEALVNFVAFLGWNPGHEREIFTLQELVAEFSLERVNKSGAIFNVEKLRWFNSEHLRRPWRRPGATAGAPEGSGDARGDSCLRGDRLMQDRLELVHDFPPEWFFTDPISYDEATLVKRWKPGSAGLLRDILPRFSTLEPFDASTIEGSVKSFAEERGVAPGELIHPLRLAVSGVGRGPGLFEMLAVLGRETVLRRISAAIELLG